MSESEKQKKYKFFKIICLKEILCLFIILFNDIEMKKLKKIK